ncbi:hypothetical protein [Roseovarius pacificus]|uniref:hypothetical protein n=1 Tax=Roseovarius pacificus TaxID=337701 RepID=UPI002A189E12|nr:hypothetical protein [Roseovarius pacificus]
MVDWQAALQHAVLQQAAPALIALPLYLVIHVAVWQVLPRERKGVVFLVLTAAVAYGAVLFFWKAPVLGHLWVSAPLYAFLVVLYMHLYFGVDRSLSVRMLGELVKSGEDFLAMDELNRRYPAGDMVARRVAVLVDKGLLVKDGERYVCAPRGRFLVRLALLGKAVYGLRATG